MLVRVVHFLRPTFFALIVFALVVGIRGAARVATSTSDLAEGRAGSPALEGLHDVDLSGVVLPSTALPAEEVVRLQVAGLGDARTDGVGILQCFVMASPGNRAVTGPLDRFGKMARQGPFRCLASPRAYLVGRPHIVQRTARVLVTVVDQQQRIHAFNFVLGRQANPPFAECWMTEAVWPSRPAAESAAMPSA